MGKNAYKEERGMRRDESDWPISAGRGESEIPREAAIDSQAIRRFYRPGVLERGLKIIAQEIGDLPPINPGEETPT